MELEIEGSNNQVAARDLYQIHNVPGRLLTKDERKELNSRVQTLAEKYGEPPWETWRLIHQAIGVEGVNQLHIEHRDQAHFILGLLEERCSLKHQLAGEAPPEPDLSDDPSTLEDRVSKGGVVTWMAEFPEYAGLLFIMGMTAGLALQMI